MKIQSLFKEDEKHRGLLSLDVLWTILTRMLFVIHARGLLLFAWSHVDVPLRNDDL